MPSYEAQAQLQRKSSVKAKTDAEEAGTAVMKQRSSVKANSLSKFMKRRDSKSGSTGGGDAGSIQEEDGGSAIVTYFGPDAGEADFKSPQKLLESSMSTCASSTSPGQPLSRQSQGQKTAPASGPPKFGTAQINPGIRASSPGTGNPNMILEESNDSPRTALGGRVAMPQTSPRRDNSPTQGRARSPGAGFATKDKAASKAANQPKPKASPPPSPSVDEMSERRTAAFKERKLARLLGSQPIGVNSTYLTPHTNTKGLTGPYDCARRSIMMYGMRAGSPGGTRLANRGNRLATPLSQGMRKRCGNHQGGNWKWDKTNMKGAVVKEDVNRNVLLSCGSAEELAADRGFSPGRCRPQNYSRGFDDKSIRQVEGLAVKTLIQPDKGEDRGAHRPNCECWTCKPVQNSLLPAAGTRMLIQSEEDEMSPYVAMTLYSGVMPHQGHCLDAPDAFHATRRFRRQQAREGQDCALTPRGAEKHHVDSVLHRSNNIKELLHNESPKEVDYRNFHNECGASGNHFDYKGKTFAPQDVIDPIGAGHDDNYRPAVRVNINEMKDATHHFDGASIKKQVKVGGTANIWRDIEKPVRRYLHPAPFGDVSPNAVGFTAESEWAGFRNNCQLRYDSCGVGNKSFTKKQFNEERTRAASCDDARVQSKKRFQAKSPEWAKDGVETLLTHDSPRELRSAREGRLQNDDTFSKACELSARCSRSTHNVAQEVVGRVQVQRSSSVASCLQWS